MFYYNELYQCNSSHIERVKVHDYSTYNKIFNKTVKKPVENIKEYTFLFGITMQRWRWPSSVK